MTARNKARSRPLPAIGLMRERELTSLMQQVLDLTASGKRNFDDVVEALRSIIDDKDSSSIVDEALQNLRSEGRGEFVVHLLGLRQSSLDDEERVLLEHYLHEHFTLDVLRHLLLAIDNRSDRRAVIARWGLDGHGAKTFREIGRVNGWLSQAARTHVGDGVNQMRRCLWAEYSDLSEFHQNRKCHLCK